MSTPSSPVPERPESEPQHGAQPATGPVDEPAREDLTASVPAPEQPAVGEEPPGSAVLRRAPKYRAFFTVGAFAGVLLGLLLGMWLSYDGMVNRWIYVVVIVAATSLVTVLVAGIVALTLDRRSVPARPTPPDTGTVEAPGA